MKEDESSTCMHCSTRKQRRCMGNLCKQLVVHREVWNMHREVKKVNNVATRRGREHWKARVSDVKEEVGLEGPT